MTGQHTLHPSAGAPGSTTTTVQVAALPGARLHVFPDTGHMPQIERTEELVELAREFGASVEQLRTPT